MKDKIFGVLQRVGRSFMLPIALLPVAGLLLGIGSSFTNETMLAAYGLNSIIHPGTLIYTILDVMSQTGSAVFNNLALLFAMGVAIGMARKEKEVAALSGAVAYIIMNTAIQAMINAAGGVDHRHHPRCAGGGAGHHHPADGCVRRHRGRSGRGGAAQQVL